MRIAIEATQAQKEATGFGYYVIRLLQAFSELETDHEFLLFHATRDWKGENFGRNFAPISYWNPTGKQSAAIFFSLNSKLLREKADLFHANGQLTAFGFKDGAFGGHDVTDIHGLEFLLDEVFHGLDIVVRHFFYVFHSCGFFRSEIPVNVSQRLEFSSVEVCQLRQWNAAQGYEILDFHADAVTDKCEFAEILPQRLCLTFISSVDRGDSHK